MLSSLSSVGDLISSRYTSRKAYIDNNNIEAYRLFHDEYGDLPLAIDIYQNNAVIHLFEPIDEGSLKKIEEALRAVLNIEHFFYKNRTKEKIDLPAQAHKEIIITEYGNKFHLNLSDYLDTGLFLDHRETRKWIAAQSTNKVVLNTFAYTGSFSIYAANGGAEKTYSVDLSKTYCEWIKKNLALNSLPPEKNWVYKMDTLEFFKYAARKNLRFDIIIIDPPTFSRNKGKSFSVTKDHPALITAALPLLTPTGFILFSTNCRDFILHEQKLPDCRVEEKQDTIPPDFGGGLPHQCFTIYDLN